MLYVKRGAAIQGPLSERQLLTVIRNGKVKIGDLVANSKDGPYENVADRVFKILSENRDVMQDDEVNTSVAGSDTDYGKQVRKNCKYCGEKILAVAVKCKFCGEFLNCDTPRSQGAGEGDASRLSLALQQAHVQLRSKNFKLAEEKFQSALDIEPHNIECWLGKAISIASQTYFGSPDSLLKHFRIEDRSEEALMCISNAEQIATSESDYLEINKVKKLVIRTCVGRLMDGSKSIVNTCLGSFNIKHNPFAAGLKVGFLSKPHRALMRCLQLAPDHAEAQEYYVKVCRALNVKPDFPPNKTSS